jgi:hypothetical protein
LKEPSLLTILLLSKESSLISRSVALRLDFVKRVL